MRLFGPRGSLRNSVPQSALLLSALWKRAPCAWRILRRQGTIVVGSDGRSGKSTILLILTQSPPALVPFAAVDVAEHVARNYAVYVPEDAPEHTADCRVSSNSWPIRPTAAPPAHIQAPITEEKPRLSAEHAESQGSFRKNIWTP